MAAWNTDGGALPQVLLPNNNFDIWFSDPVGGAYCSFKGNMSDLAGEESEPIYKTPIWPTTGAYYDLAIFNTYPIPPYEVEHKYQVIFQGSCIYTNDPTAPSEYRYNIKLLFVDVTDNTILHQYEVSDYLWLGNVPNRKMHGVYMFGYFGNDDPTYGNNVCGMGVGLGNYDTNEEIYLSWNNEGVGLNREYIRNTYHVDINPTPAEPEPDVDDPNDDDDGNSGPGGGGGDHDHDTDDISVPFLPTLSAIDTGFISMYIAGLPAIQALASELWDNNILTIIEHYFEHPWDYVEGLAICPCTPDWESIVYPKIGSHQLNTTLRLVSNQYVEVDCGSLDINEFYASALDYSPYEKLQLHLPYCGCHDLDIDEIMNTTIKVVYHVDCLSGACVAFVTLTGRGATDGVRYEYTGNVLSHIPITSRSYDEVVKATAQLSATVLGTLIAPGPSAGAALGAGGKKPTAKQIARAEHAQAVQDYEDNMNLATSVSNVMSAKPQIMRGGGLSSTMGLLGVQIPFVTRTIPRQSLPQNYRTYEGYPSNMTETLGNLNGFTKIYSIRPNGFTCTTEELGEIISMLKEGVIL